ncbi:hypothetical protein C7999DRAFT_34478 [Corynascus novoguineensis]|uniref:Inner centromere protein ARK-binding domain-containing protein n=1 Tax=Corynascus novoguineensis TaxID=1126955 RepID=A0AAN7CNS0_9PEZI|nr:hypothetical protein C7999DRAFT_34478 [Corynascus novoguineensis]
MAARGGPRLQVGSAAWIAEERNAALGIAQSEIEEFSFSARNEIDWLNEHMAEIFSESQMNVAELFKTPGKLRGKTPRTARKAPLNSVRMPLSDTFSAIINGTGSSPFAMQNHSQPQSPGIPIAEDKPEPDVALSEGPAKPAVVHPPHQVEPRAPVSLGDSGYHGSQSQDTIPFDHFEKDIEMSDSPQRTLRTSDPKLPLSREPEEQAGSSSAAPHQTTSSATKENQATQSTTNATATGFDKPSTAAVQLSSPFASRTRLPIMSPRSPSPQKMSSPPRQPPQQPMSPQKPPSPRKSSSSPQSSITNPQKGSSKPTDDLNQAVDKGDDEMVDEVDEVDEARSPSDASSPIRPVVRKSSLNFASLPAREPLASKKSLGGARISRTSHLDFHRQSYFNRPTGGKSLGGAMRRESLEDDADEMDVDDDLRPQNEDATAYSKTYTQRLQDQISMLGKGQSIGPRPSKSLANLLPSQQSAPTSQIQSQAEHVPEDKKSSPKPIHLAAAPGAFPMDEDDEDDWIAPPNTATKPANPKPVLPDTQRSDAREELSSRGTTTSSEHFKGGDASPTKPTMPEWTPKHGKSASVPVFPTTDQLDVETEGSPLKKTTSVTNQALSTVAEDDFFSPPKSPTRTFRESPLKQVKNKLSSLLKGSKGLVASSAAISAEGKSLVQSPSTTRLGHHQEASVESFKTVDNVVYPDLSQYASATSAPLSPVRSNSSRRTRASAERERQEAKEREREEREREKEKEKEKREAKRMAEQMDKLEKAREKEREKARVFSKEQEKIAAMEKQVAVQKEPGKPVQGQSQQDFRTPGPTLKTRPRSPTKSTKPTPARTNEHEGKQRTAPPDEQDVEMTDTTTTVPPPSIPRPTTATSIRTQKRPMKPTKETASKAKQMPTLIRVNPLSSQQTQFHPSNSVLAANLQETLGQPPSSARQVNGKASQASLHGKGSVQSLKSSVSSTGRPKALEAAAKRKEQEEREAQRKRENKQEMERKRAAQEEERRQEQQRKAEAERQKEEERKAAQRRAAIERAKQTKAPPPAVRPQPNGPPEYTIAEKGTLRPPSRLGSTMHQEGRLVNTVLSSAAKGPSSKRPLQQDAGEESSRSQQQRALPSFPAKEAKRMRMSEEFDEDLDMMDHNPRIIKNPPVRPSAGFKKDLQPRPTYNNGYPHAPPPSATKDLFKTTVTAQHNSHSKPAHPLDMAQFSKGAIPFAQNSAHQQQHKTPARPMGGGIPKSGKSVARSSPRAVNGDAIELPDIQTDDDSDDDDGHMPIAAWADSPALRDALLRQERLDPMQVFGPPAPLNMEEVFSKNKDRFHKFRARTSSANWSGTDRLTEEEVRRDAAARDKMRREGGWTYELSRDLA